MNLECRLEIRMFFWNEELYSFIWWEHVWSLWSLWRASMRSSAGMLRISRMRSDNMGWKMERGIYRGGCGCETCVGRMFYIM